MTAHTTTTPGSAGTSPSYPPPGIPRLETGDHLTREEFERRYEAMPALKKAELIEGVVYVPSAVRFEQHGKQHADLMTWLGVYRAHTPGVHAGDNTTVRLDMDNEPQPDAVLLIDPTHAGQAQIDADGYIAGAPEFAAEVASSSASLDLNAKSRVYRRNGVREYLVWRVLDQAIDWFVLRNSQYERLALGPSGWYQSQIMPGLWLDPDALVRGDLLQVLQRLQQGLASPEHAAFVTKLQQAASRGP
jgi:Uma2 family endonuclease